MNRYFNTLRSPLVYNTEGNSVGGGEWFDSSVENDLISNALSRGDFIDLTEDEVIELEYEDSAPEDDGDSDDEEIDEENEEG